MIKAKIPTKEEMQQILENTKYKIKLWKTETLEEQILTKLRKGEARAYKFTPQMAIGFLYIKESETICTHTACDNCGISYLAVYLEKQLTEQERKELL